MQARRPTSACSAGHQPPAALPLHQRCRLAAVTGSSHTKCIEQDEHHLQSSWQQGFTPPAHQRVEQHDGGDEGEHGDQGDVQVLAGEGQLVAKQLVLGRHDEGGESSGLRAGRWAGGQAAAAGGQACRRRVGRRQRQVGGDSAAHCSVAPDLLMLS